MAQKIQMRGIIIGIIFLIFGACIVPFITIVQAEINWDATVNFNEPGGTFDNVTFGEAPDAHGGEPADNYDINKPFAPLPPYIRAYFKDNLLTPFDKLWSDYRHYPDTTKVWNLSVQWYPEDEVSPTTITMSWSTAQVIQSGYTNVSLCTNTGDFLKNMLVDTTYSFSCPALTILNFKIICQPQPWVNRAPVFSSPSPTNGSSGVNRYHATNVTVSDLDGNETTVCFWYSTVGVSGPWTKAQQNNNVAANTTVRDLNTSYASGWNTQYWWRVTAYDGHANSSVVYRFTTKSQQWVNRAPAFSNPSPLNGTTGVNRYHATNITVSDLDGNLTTVCFWYSTVGISGPWTKAQQNNNVAANTTVRDLNSSYASGWNTQYWWRVTAFDGHVNSSVVYTFITRAMGNNPPVFATPSPANGSTGNPLSHTWSIPINDLEGNLFSWSIQCSNGQRNSNTSALNGTKSLSLSGLAYVTTYKIWVNATDPTGSANYTRKWYTFTTRSSGGGGGGGGGDDEPPNIKPNADVSAREPYQGYVNTEITFDGSKSNDSDGTITKWFWVFGDNTNGTGNTVRHTYSKTGTYTVTLTVTDNEGLTNTDTTTCVIIQYNGSNNSPTTPVINGTRTGIKNKTYTYSIYSTDQNNDSLQYITTWGDGTQNTSNFLQNGTIFSVSHTWVAPGKYMITAIATDNMSISDQGTFSVFIDVFFVRELGFLFDSNNDGLNDSFYTNSTGLITPAQKLANESYLIDTDSDGISNYVYNPSLNALTELKKIEITAEFPWVYVALLLVVVVIVSCVAVFYLYQYGYI